MQTAHECLFVEFPFHRFNFYKFFLFLSCLHSAKCLLSLKLGQVESLHSFASKQFESKSKSERKMAEEMSQREIQTTYAARFIDRPPCLLKWKVSRNTNGWKWTKVFIFSLFYNFHFVPLTSSISHFPWSYLSLKYKEEEEEIID